MFCQKCRTPLKVHSSLDDLNPASFHLLADALAPPESNATALPVPYSKEQEELYNEASKTSNAPLIRTDLGAAGDKYHSAASGKAASPKDRSTMSFVNITESQVVSPAVAQKANPQVRQQARRSWSRRASGQSESNGEENLLSHKMETSTRLFEILSARSDIDHPVCTECTELLLEGMEKRLASVTRERDAFLDYLKNAQADLPTDEEVAQTEKDLAAMKEKEKEALVELRELEAEKAALEEEVAALDKESRELDVEEEEFWRERNSFAQTLAEFQNKRDSLNLRYDNDSRLLQRLQRTNVYNDTFNISHDGSFGTINGLRLGRLSSVTVDWSEINAAWGQACLLLVTVADRLNYTFQGYRLHPMGSTSTIEKLEKTSQRSSTVDANSPKNSAQTASTSLSLYYSSDLPAALTFLHRNFDNAMVAFLECVRQLFGHVERSSQDNAARGADFKFPYEIRKDRINDCSIKLPGFNGDEEWTKACKYTLTCCKFLLAHASNVHWAKENAG